MAIIVCCEGADAGNAFEKGVWNVAFGILSSAIQHIYWKMFCSVIGLQLAPKSERMRFISSSNSSSISAPVVNLFESNSS